MTSSNKNSQGFSQPNLFYIHHPDMIKQKKDFLVGLEDQVDDISRVLVAVKHYEELKRSKFADGGKLVLEGPPGTGKTAAVFVAAKKHNFSIIQYFSHHLITMSPQEAISSLKSIFEAAKDLETPSIILIEQIDSLMVNDSKGQGTLSRTLEPFLFKLFSKNLLKDHLCVIVESHQFSCLNLSLLELLDGIVSFPLPGSSEVRRKIIDNHLSLIDPEIAGIHFSNLDFIAIETEDFSGRNLKKLVRIALYNALQRSERNFPTSLSDLDMEIALNFCLKSKHVSKEASGLLLPTETILVLNKRLNALVEQINLQRGAFRHSLEFALTNKKMARVLRVLALSPEGMSRSRLLKTAGITSRSFENSFNEGFGVLLVSFDPGKDWYYLAVDDSEIRTYIIDKTT